MNSITVEEIKQRLDAGENLHLLDVREPEENAQFNIGGQLYPVGKIQRMETEGLENLKNEEVICYCRSGNRSMLAVLFLKQQGFENVKNLTGGMEAWKQKFGEEF